MGNLEIFYFSSFPFFFLKILFTLFLDGEEGKKRGKETSMCGYLSHASHWGPGPRPKHVP